MFHMCLELDALSTGETRYLAVPTSCRLVKAQTALFTVIDSSDETITFSDGTTTIGTITITQSGCAEGDIDTMSVDSSSNGEVELNETTPLKIVNAGNPNSTGDAMLTLTFDEFHAVI